ncbi:MAG TPA: chitobiase/beta-hexosaminidase C-terminal domain-containing protein, partial [Caldilineaceae bacterium]|nr:chitobiase/beta-hexosaminidase C-terminal domain-containing protein [Caldilineaceae bacterium]
MLLQFMRLLLPYGLTLLLVLQLGAEAKVFSNSGNPPAQQDVYLPLVVSLPTETAFPQIPPSPTFAPTAEPTNTPDGPTATPGPPLPNAVFYISPTGSDENSGKSEAQAWATFAHAWENLLAGDTLILLDGVYRQSLAPDQQDGTAQQPITIRAKNDGKAIIDGEYQRVPVQLGRWPGSKRDYYVIEGIVARNSNDHVFDINGNHNILRRVSGYNADTNRNSHVFTITGKYTLLEDCIASGTGRKMVFTWGGQFNIIRRCFTNWQSFDGREFDSNWPWGEDLEFYNSSDSVIEDSVSYGSPPTTGVSILGNIDSANGNTPFTRNNKVLGVMAIRNGVFKDGTFWEWPTTRPQPTETDVIISHHMKTWTKARAGFGVLLWGQDAEVSNILFQDIFSWGNASLGFSEVGQFHPSSNMTINRATLLNNGLDLGASQSSVGTNVIMDEIAHYAISDSKIEGTQYQGNGARFEHRYVDGVLMDGSNGQSAQPLWPWPMQDRVLTELGIDVTGELTQILQNAGVPTGATLPPPTISPMPPPANPVKNAGVPTFLGSVAVTLSAPTTGAEIRYTVDGSEPGPNAPLYNGPLTLNKTTLLRAKTYFNGQVSFASSAYYPIDPAAANQPPVVEANLLPFVYPEAELMLPNNQIGLYGSAEDFTLTGSSGALATTWSVASGPTGVTFAAAHALRTVATFTQPGEYVLRLTADDGMMSASADALVTVLPRGGNRISLPGRVEAENYKGGGEGVGYHDTSHGNYGQVYNLGKLATIYRADDVDLTIAINQYTGYAVMHMTPGEWLTYDVNVTEPGAYTLRLRVAGAIAGGVVHVELNGADISGPIKLPYTNDGLRIYTTLTIQTSDLPAGQHPLRLVADQA